jgi:thiol-disulfide isomerase/thioredoxin
MNTSCSKAESQLTNDEWPAANAPEQRTAMSAVAASPDMAVRCSFPPGTSADRTTGAFAPPLEFGFRATFVEKGSRFVFRARKCAALLTLLLTTLLAAAAPLKTGDAFPDLTKFNLEGTLPDTKGKIVLVDFFASWCGPCKESFPAMQELHKKFAGKDFVIIAINLDQKKADMDDFLNKHPADFAIVRDGANKLVSTVKIPTMPTSFLLGRDGKVVSVHRGFKGEETRKKYAEEIEALLK